MSDLTYAQPKSDDCKNIINRLKQAIFDMKAYNVRVNSVDRLHEYIKTLEHFDSFPQEALHDASLVERLSHAFAETLRILDIIETLRIPPAVTDWHKHFQRVLKGTYFPGREPGMWSIPGCHITAARSPQYAPAFSLGIQTTLQTLIQEPFRTDQESRTIERDDPARNKQFELFIAADARQRGYDVELLEPDIILRDSRHGTIGLAAKRIKSLHTFEEQLLDGAEQVFKHCKLGFIAIDLTLAFDLHHKLFVLESANDYAELHEAFYEVVASAGHRVSKWIQHSNFGEPVGGVIAHARAMVFVRETKQFLTLRNSFSGPLGPPGRPGFEFLRCFTEGRRSYQSKTRDL